MGCLKNKKKWKKESDGQVVFCKCAYNCHLKNCFYLLCCILLCSADLLWPESCTACWGVTVGGTEWYHWCSAHKHAHMHTLLHVSLVCSCTVSHCNQTKTAAFCRPAGQKREERDSYSVTSAPRWDPSQHWKPPPCTGSSRMLVCLNWRSAEKWKGGRQREREKEREELGERGKNKGEGEKKTKSEQAHFGRISSGWRGEERLMMVGGGALGEPFANMQLHVCWTEPCCGN